MLTNIIQGTLDIFLVSEIKIDISFPSEQFIIPGFAPPYRFDKNSKGGGLLLYLSEDIPSKIIFVFRLPIEGFLIEVNICRKKWLLGCFYNPHKTYISDFWKEINKVLDLTILRSLTDVPPPINFAKNFHPGHSYFTPPAY